MIWSSSFVRFSVLLLCLSGWASLSFGQSAQSAILDRSVIEDRLDDFPGDNQQRQKSLSQLFVEAGCENISEQQVSLTSAPNTICTLKGSSNAVIVVGGHFDKVHRGDGVVDNWSGASLLPSLYQSIAVQQPRHSFVFIGFTDEEKGLVGSKHYVLNLTVEEKESIRAMINLDTLGLGPTKVWMSTADPELYRLLEEVNLDLRLPMSVYNVEGLGVSDSEAFRKAGMPTIMFHSVTRETLSLLHSERDRLDAVQLEDFYQTFQLVAAYLNHLDVTLP